MTTAAFYPIGTPGQPWGPVEVATWRAQQVPQRSYAVDVVSVIERLRERFDVVQYGTLNYPPDHYPWFALKSREWKEGLPVALVTGGVHGYETSGVLGALQFVDQHAVDYAGRINLLVAPCVSPCSAVSSCPIICVAQSCATPMRIMSFSARVAASIYSDITA